MYFALKCLAKTIIFYKNPNFGRKANILAKNRQQNCNFRAIARFRTMFETLARDVVVAPVAAAVAPSGFVRMFMMVEICLNFILALLLRLYVDILEQP